MIDVQHQSSTFRKCYNQNYYFYAMKQKLLLVFFGNLMALNAQYQFTGQVPDQMENKSVFLSLVENYRKSSRVYKDQILSEVKTEAKGKFLFSGDNLSKDNRIYRIHIDGCPEYQPDSHFLRNCNNTQSILFIAKKGDTINFPLLANNQALCEVASTNEHSEILLEIDALKEEMILEFTEQSSKANENLNYQKWFCALQEFGEQSNEPLAELYIHSFLSNRSNETYDYYLKDLKNSTYYDELLKRLNTTYKTAPFAFQYMKELVADKSQLKIEPKEEPEFGFIKIAGILGLIGVLSVLLLKYNPRSKLKYSTIKSELSPQEQRVYSAIQNNKTNKEIASELFVSLSTVKTHINNIYRKLNITSREQIKKNPPGV